MPGAARRGNRRARRSRAAGRLLCAEVGRVVGPPSPVSAARGEGYESRCGFLYRPRSARPTERSTPACPATGRRPSYTSRLRSKSARTIHTDAAGIRPVANWSTNKRMEWRGSVWIIHHRKRRSVRMAGGRATVVSCRITGTTRLVPPTWQRTRRPLPLGRRGGLARRCDRP